MTENTSRLKAVLAYRYRIEREPELATTLGPERYQP
jgi:hypothetical protein